jgi:hypothetical protein
MTKERSEAKDSSSFPRRLPGDSVVPHVIAVYKGAASPRFRSSAEVVEDRKSSTSSSALSYYQTNLSSWDIHQTTLPTMSFPSILIVGATGNTGVGVVKTLVSNLASSPFAQHKLIALTRTLRERRPKNSTRSLTMSRLSRRTGRRSIPTGLKSARSKGCSWRAITG